MGSHQVTFVVATYKRVEALKCTLQSIRLQDHRDWTAIVVGDCCGDDTYEMIRSLDDFRIKYYNLPARFGEQSGPNSFGLSLATGDFIAFLNHDDLLLRDHLVYSLGQMTAHGTDIFIGESANATRLNFEAGGTVVPVFTDILPAQKKMSSLIHPNPYIFDPSSFWLVRTPYAKRVGPWRPASELWRTPLRDWIMRAWRLGGKFTFGDRITGLRFWTQNLRKGAPLYSNHTPEQEYMIGRIQAEAPEETRRYLHRQIEEAGKQDVNAAERGRHPHPRSVTAFTKRCTKNILAEFYLQFGIDLVILSDRLSGCPKGKVLNQISRKRTGENLPETPAIIDLLESPETYRLL